MGIKWSESECRLPFMGYAHRGQYIPNWLASISNQLDKDTQYKVASLNFSFLPKEVNEQGRDTNDFRSTGFPGSCLMKSNDGAGCVMSFNKVGKGAFIMMESSKPDGWYDRT